MIDMTSVPQKMSVGRISSYQLIYDFTYAMMLAGKNIVSKDGQNINLQLNSDLPGSIPTLQYNKIIYFTYLQDHTAYTVKSLSLMLLICYHYKIRSTITFDVFHTTQALLREYYTITPEKSAYTCTCI